MISATDTAGKTLNDLLWGACGTANSTLYVMSQSNDPVPDILAYLRAQSQAEVAAMVASAELYGEFQTGWRTEMSSSLSDGDTRSAAVEADIDWAVKVAAARNAYYSALGGAAATYNNAVIDALEAYNSTMLSAEIKRAQDRFSASETYSKDLYDLEGDYAKAQFDTYKNYALSTLDASISETNSLAASDAYFARIAADNYGTITVDDDAYAMRQQFDNDNFQAQNTERKEINAAKADAVNAVKKETRNAVNNDFTGYFESLIGIQTTYENAIAAADETYYGTVTTANATADETINTAGHAYDTAIEQLDEQFEEALEIIDEGGDIETEHFNATPAVSANAQQNGNNGNNQNSTGSWIVGQFKGFTAGVGKLWGWFVGTDGGIQVTETFDSLPRKNLGNVPQNLEKVAGDLRVVPLGNQKLNQEIKGTEQIIGYVDNVADGITATIFVASLFLPGPDDIFWGYVGSKYGIKIVTEAGSRFLYRNGEKLSGAGLEAAEEILLRIKIAKHSQDSSHFPGKTLEQLDNLIQSTIKNGKKYEHPTIQNRTLYHDKSTGIIVIYDGKGGGTIFRPDDAKSRVKLFLTD